MTGEQGAIAALSAATGAVVAGTLIGIAIERAPGVLRRINVTGAIVPAVLGGPLALGGLAALVLLSALGAAGWDAAGPGAIGAAAAFLIGLMAAAGHLDDRRGAETPSGYRGHLAALRRGRFTGGVLKIAAGAVAGLLAGGLVADGREAIEIALLCALGANLFNLLDRAPGRAGKAALLVAVPVAALGSPRWALQAAGLLGALVVCLPYDLSERAMLGDAGANPLGAVLGLGLGVSLPEPWRLAALGLVAALNLASERWSFSGVIEAVPLLRALDRLGRGRRSGSGGPK